MSGRVKDNNFFKIIIITSPPQFPLPHLIPVPPQSPLCVPHSFHLYFYAEKDKPSMDSNQTYHIKLW